MGIPYYPPISLRRGCFLLGISLASLHQLIQTSEIEASTRGGKKLLLNNDTLNNYIQKHGGRAQRWKEFRNEFVHDRQLRDIKRYASLVDKKYENLIDLTKHEYDGIDICNMLTIINEKKRLDKVHDELHRCDITDDILEGFYGKNYLDVAFENRRLHLASDEYRSFLHKYKPCTQAYDNIKFLKLSDLRPIIQEARKKFNSQ